MIVSNTSPLRYLIAVGSADLIARLLGVTLIPPGVWAELTHDSSPKQVCAWMRNRPEWLQIRDLRRPPSQDLLHRLDRGESEAIQLAIEVQADFILMDERLGRQIAASQGLTVVGALGILLESYRQNLIDEPLDILNQMRVIGFRLSPELYLQFQIQIASVSRRL